MAKQPNPKLHLLRWSEQVQSSDVQDPLGLNLRGLTRLGERLLHCITSITPRARYYSFIPWCVFDFQSREKGKPFALGLREAIVVRENALTLGCVSHHQGEPCRGGALVGSNEAKRWLGKGNTEADLRRLKLAKNPALNAYFTSLVNLGCFVTDMDDSVADDAEDEVQFTFDDVELSPLGLELAKTYDSIVGGLQVIRQLAGQNRRCSVKSIAEIGTWGGLCELAEPGAPDRKLLRDLFFASHDDKKGSHHIRRQSLLLLLDLCRQFSANGWALDEPNFEGAVYFGELVTEDERQEVAVAPALHDVATRWRMFYFHHYMGLALEGLFSWLLAQLETSGLAGLTLEELASRLNDKVVRTNLSELLRCDLKIPIGQSSPSELFAHLGLPHGDLNAEFGKHFDVKVQSMQPVAEDTLETLLRDGDYLQSSTGLALPMILLSTTLMRYARWESSKYGKWLATAAKDPYVDLVPPVLAGGLTRQFGHWWNCRWKDLTQFVLSRYVVRQHQSMSYEKSWSGDRCLLHVDGSKIFSTDTYEKIGMGNPRLGSAIRILKDLALMEEEDDDGLVGLTKEGKLLLHQELKKEISP